MTLEELFEKFGKPSSYEAAYDTLYNQLYPPAYSVGADGHRDSNTPEVKSAIADFKEYQQWYEAEFAEERTEARCRNQERLEGINEKTDPFLNGVSVSLLKSMI